MALKARLLEALLHIKKHGPVKPQFGICYTANLLVQHEYSDQIYCACVMKCKDWPKGDGSMWPVAGEDERLGCDDYNAWDINTEAGARRHELLDWLIEELQNGNLS